MALIVPSGVWFENSLLSRASGGTWLLQLSDSDKAYAGSEILYWLQEP